MTKLVKVLVKEVGKAPEYKTIKDDYKEFRKITEGAFSGYGARQFVTSLAGMYLKNVMLLCNDTGKLDGLPFNCYFGSEDLVGNVLFVAYGQHGDTIDLTEAQAEIIKQCIPF